MKRKHSDQTNKHERNREIHHINKTMCFYICKQRQLTNQERVFEPRDHRNAKSSLQPETVLFSDRW